MRSVRDGRDPSRVVAEQPVHEVEVASKTAPSVPLRIPTHSGTSSVRRDAVRRMPTVMLPSIGSVGSTERARSDRGGSPWTPHHDWRHRETISQPARRVRTGSAIVCR